MMKFKVIEDQLTVIAEDIPTREEAINIAKTHHEAFPQKYHEVCRFSETLGKFIGIAQWKPRDIVRRES